MGLHVLIKAFPGTVCMNCIYVCVFVCLYACDVCACEFFSPDRPLKFTSPHPPVHGHMVVTSHTPVKANVT